MDYGIFYKDELPPVDEDWEDIGWDIFIGSYNSSERVQRVFDKAPAKQRHWFVVLDYGYAPEELPKQGVYRCTSRREDEAVLAFAQKRLPDNLQGLKIAIDITGFIKPYMMFLLFYLQRKGVRALDVIYSEPDQYAKKEKTRFSDGPVTEVRQIVGFEGTHNPSIDDDLLIVGAGYDDDLISEAAKAKPRARKAQIFGFPSLRADMYQENVIRASKAAEDMGGDIRGNRYFAPAYDPFVTASTIARIRDKFKPTNLYLCPLATKPQALGFTIYYLWECRQDSVSMIYPFCESHAPETGKGIGRIWKYSVELPES